MLFDYFTNISFARPWLFALLGLLPLLIFWYARKNDSRSASLRISTLAASGLSSWKSSLRHVPFICRMLSIAFLVVCIAGPQTKNSERQTDGEGIDIMLCIDVSGSMTAQDLQPNRMEAAKNVAVDFVKRRVTDRIGVVIFSGESFTQCPLTTDHEVVISAIQNIHNGLLEDGTAIGSGLATGVDRLRSSTSKSKIVVLLTDGENNGGLIDPQTAKEIAKTYGIKVYTIGLGTDGLAPLPVQTPLGVEVQMMKVAIDEKLLQEIADETGGRYFRAKDNAGLEGIYATIDGLEKSKMEITTSIKVTDKFLPFAIGAAFFLLLEIMLRYLVFRKFP